MPDLTAAQIAGMRATHETFLSKVATRRRFALVEDQYRDKIRGAPSDLTNIHVEIWQENANEDRTDRDQQTRRGLARLPIGTDITGRDQLIVDGITYEVDGPVADRFTHLMAKLLYVEG